MMTDNVTYNLIPLDVSEYACEIGESPNGPIILLSRFEHLGARWWEKIELPPAPNK